MEKLIYFDHAATSWPKPPDVGRAMAEALSERGGNPGRSAHILSVRASEIIYQCREAVCDLFHYSSPERVVFTSNTTYALNTAIKGLVTPGIHVVTSDLEHNSVLRPLYRLSTDPCYHIGVTQFDATGTDDETVYCFKRALRPDTRLAVITAASNVCGHILPIERLAAICRDRRILLIVDGAQSGGILPMDFSALGADILCLAGHKGLYGPQGTGILLCREGVEPVSLAEGGNGIRSEEMTMGDDLPERLEAGTQNTPGIAGLLAGIRYVKSSGIDEIRETTDYLVRYASERLPAIRDIRTYGECGMRTPVILFNKDGVSCDRVAGYLADHGICTRSGLHCAPYAHKALGSGLGGGVRISFGHHNTTREIDRFLLTLERMPSV